MNKRDKNEEARRYLDRFFDFLAEPPEDINLVKGALAEDGVDVEAFLDRTQKLIEQLKESDRLGWMKEAQKEKERAASFSPDASKYVTLKREDLMAKLRGLAAAQQQFAARNLDKLTEDEMRNLIAQIESLQESENDPDG